MAQNRQELNKRIDEWQKKNIKRVVIKLNKRTDADIIQELGQKESVQGYIKEAIRDYMNK